MAALVGDLYTMSKQSSTGVQTPSRTITLREHDPEEDKKPEIEVEAPQEEAEVQQEPQYTQEQQNSALAAVDIALNAKKLWLGDDYEFSPEQADAIKTLVLTSQDPSTSVGKYIAASGLSSMLGMDTNYAYQNMDEISRFYTGHDYEAQDPDLSGRVIAGIKNVINMGRKDDWRKLDLAGKTEEADALAKIIKEKDAEIGDKLNTLPYSIAEKYATDVLSNFGYITIPTLKGAATGAAVNITMKSMLGSAVAAGTINPIAAGAITTGFVAAATLFAVKGVSGVEMARYQRGEDYWNYRHNYPDFDNKELANALASTNGSMTMLVETLLDGVSSKATSYVAGKLGADATELGINALVNLGKKGTMSSVAKGLIDWVTGGLDEGFINELPEYLLGEAFDAIYRKAGGIPDPKTWEQRKEEAKESVWSGIVVGLVYGSAEVPASVKADKNLSMALRREANRSSSWTEFVEKTNAIRPESIEKTDFDTARQQIYTASVDQRTSVMKEKYAGTVLESAEIAQQELYTTVDEMGVETSKVLPDGKVYRTEENGLYSESNRKNDGSYDIVFGDKDTGAVYGYVNVDSDGTTQTVRDVRVRQGYETIRSEMVKDALASTQSSETDVKWEPTTAGLQKVKQDLIDSNPNKTGLNYEFRAPDSNTDIKALASEIKKSATNLTDQEAIVAARLYSIADQGGTLTSVNQGQRFAGVEAIPQDQLGGRSLSDFNAASNKAKALIYMGQQTNVSSFTHELFHVVSSQRQEEAAQLSTAISKTMADDIEREKLASFVANNKAIWEAAGRHESVDTIMERLASIAEGAKSWNVEVEEDLARLWEAYQASSNSIRQSLPAGVRALLQKISDMMKSVYRTLRDATPLNKDIAEAYDRLMGTAERTGAASSSNAGGIALQTREQDILYQENTPERIAEAYKTLENYSVSERARIEKNLAEHEGTPWYKQAIASLLVRNDMKAVMEGKDISEDSMLNEVSPKVLAALRNGNEGVFNYLAQTSFIGEPSKPKYAVNSSLLNCNPSKDCAKFCYASKGRYELASSIVKSELVNLAVEADPVRAARMTANQYRATTDANVKKALRIFDKGDFSASYVKYVKELNRLGVATQIFSKRPEFLSQIDPKKNVVMLSIDSSNIELAANNPDLPLAIVYSGAKDVPLISENQERFEAHGGVILPVKLGNKYLSKEQIDAMPAWAKKNYTCPIDAGILKLGQWSCRECDQTGRGGCFFSRSEKDRQLIPQALDRMGEGERNELFDQFENIIRREYAGNESAAELRRILENLALLRSGELDDPDTRTTASGAGQSEADSKSDGIKYQDKDSLKKEWMEAYGEELKDDDIYSYNGNYYVKDDPGFDYSEENIRSIVEGQANVLEEVRQSWLFTPEELAGGLFGDNNLSSTIGNNTKVRKEYPLEFIPGKGWTGKESNPTVIENSWKELGFISFIGAEIKTLVDLVQMYSIFRNPALEYSHIVLAKSGKIVRQIGMTSGVSGSTRVFPAGVDLKDFFSKIDYDQAYILHNHPSGDVSPSIQDFKVTEGFIKNAFGDKFAGHIIFDHTSYTVLQPDGFGGLSSTVESAPEGYHQIKPRQLLSSESMVDPRSIASTYLANNQNGNVVMNVDNQYRVFGFDPIAIDANVSQSDFIDMMRQILLNQEENIYRRPVLILGDKDVYNQIKSFSNGLMFPFLDILHVDSNGSFTSGMAEGWMKQFDWQKQYMQYTANKLDWAWDKTDAAGTMFQDKESLKEEWKNTYGTDLDDEEIYSYNGNYYVKDDPSFDYSEENIRSIIEEQANILEEINQGWLFTPEELAGGLFGSNNLFSQPDPNASVAPAPQKKPRGVYPENFEPGKGWNGKEKSPTLTQNNWKEFGFVSFIGAKVKSHVDVAQMMSIFRNPKIEFSHLVFVKNEEIVRQFAVTSGLPGSTPGFPKGMSYIDKLSLFSSFDYDEVYSLHNHPAGDPTPSPADRAFTKWARDNFFGSKFKGEIVLDHTQYAVISSTGRTSFHNVPQGYHQIAGVTSMGKIKYIEDIATKFIELKQSGNVFAHLSSKLDILDFSPANIPTNLTLANYKKFLNDFVENLVDKSFQRGMLIVDDAAVYEKLKSFKGKVYNPIECVVLMQNGKYIRNSLSEGWTKESKWQDRYDSQKSKSWAWDKTDSAGTVFQDVTDSETLERLNSSTPVKAYRAMQVIDGKLYPPMAAVVGGQLVQPTELGKWYQADEHPELLDKNGKFVLNKGGKDATGKKLGDVPAAYNPYWHTSLSMLNDQFSSAYKRPNLVTVEVEVPDFELTSGYKAEGAKNAVGKTDWHSGPVASKLGKIGKPREVILSRYVKVTRIIPDSEVAASIAKNLEGTGIEVPDNTVTPSLLAELKKLGVKIKETGEVKKYNGLYLQSSDNFSKWFGKSKAVDENGEPMVLYHGSPVKGIEIFDTEGNYNVNGGEKGLIYASDDADIGEYFSREYTEGSSAFRVRPTGNVGEVYPVYMSIQHPLDFRNLTEEDKDIIVKTSAAEWGFSEEEQRRKLDEAIKYGNDQLVKFYAMEVLQDLKKYGYDGLIARMGRSWNNALEVAVASKNQIKSIYNNGGWSLDDDRIHFQELDYIEDEADARAAVEALGGDDYNDYDVLIDRNSYDFDMPQAWNPDIYEGEGVQDPIDYEAMLSGEAEKTEAKPQQEKPKKDVSSIMTNVDNTDMEWKDWAHENAPQVTYEGTEEQKDRQFSDAIDDDETFRRYLGIIGEALLLDTPSTNAYYEDEWSDEWKRYESVRKVDPYIDEQYRLGLQQRVEGQVDDADVRKASKYALEGKDFPKTTGLEDKVRATMKANARAYRNVLATLTADKAMLPETLVRTDTRLELPGRDKLDLMPISELSALAAQINRTDIMNRIQTGTLKFGGDIDEQTFSSLVDTIKRQQEQIKSNAKDAKDMEANAARLEKAYADAKDKISRRDESIASAESLLSTFRNVLAGNDTSSNPSAKRYGELMAKKANLTEEADYQQRATAKGSRDKGKQIGAKLGTDRWMSDLASMYPELFHDEAGNLLVWKAGKENNAQNKQIRENIAQELSRIDEEMHELRVKMMDSAVRSLMLNANQVNKALDLVKQGLDANSKVLGQEAIQAYKDEIAALEKQNDDLVKAIDTLKAQVADRKTQTADLAAKVNELTAEVKAGQAEAKKAARKISDLQNRLEKAKETIRDIKAEYDDKEKALRKSIADERRKKKVLDTIRQQKYKIAQAIMRPVNLNTVDYDTAAQAIIALQSLVDPKFRRDWVYDISEDPMQETGHQTMTIEQAKAYFKGLDDAQRIDLMQYLSQDLIDRLTEQKRPLNDWTIQELKQLASQIDDLRKRGAEVLRAKREFERKQVQTIQKSIIDSLAPRRNGKKTLPGSVDRLAERRTFRNKLSGMLFSTFRMQELAQLLDGGFGDRGYAYKLLVDDKRAHQNNEWRAVEKRYASVEPYMTKSNLEQMVQRVAVDFGNGFVQEFTVDELAYVYLSKRDEQNRQAVAYGALLTEDEKGTKIDKGINPLTGEEVNEYLTRSKDLIPDDNDLKDVGDMRYSILWKTADRELEARGLKDLVEAVSADFNNPENTRRLNRASIEAYNRPLDARQYYLSIHRTDLKGDSFENDLADSLFNLNTNSITRDPEKGFLVERITINPRNQKNLNLSLLNGWQQSVKDQEHLIENAAYVKRLRSVFETNGARQVIRAVNEAYGPALSKEITEYIELVANPYQGNSRSNGDTLAKTVRGRTGAAFLGWKPSGIVLQGITSPAPYLSEIDPAHLMAAYAQIAAHPIESINEINSKSIFMKNRTMNTIVDESVQRQNKWDASGFDLFMNKQEELGQLGLTMVDRYAVAGGWLAMYQRTLKENLESGMDTATAESAAVQKADNFVLRTQPVGDPTELASLFRQKSELAKTVLQFQTSLNVIWNNLGPNMIGYARKREFGKMVGTAFGYAMAGVILGLVADGFDDDDDTKDKAKQLVYWALTQELDSVPILGSFMDQLAQKVVTGKVEYSSRGVSIYPGLDKIYQAITAVSNDDWKKAAVRLAEGAGIYAGAPVSGIKQNYRALTGEWGALLGR